VSGHRFELEGLDYQFGGLTSWKTPRKANSFPSASLCMKRQAPYRLASSLSILVAYLAGPHHCGIRSGSVYARNTRVRVRPRS